MPYTLIIDIAVAVLLVVTIGYAVTLNRRLQSLRRDKKDLENLARTFGESTLRAEENINQLRTVAQALDIQMGRAQSLRDDLAFLNDRGGSAADRLEELVREARDGLGAVPTPPSASQGSSAPKPKASKSPLTASKEESDNVEGRSEAERELLRALKDAG
mgnify:CR=1 FL=1